MQYQPRTEYLKTQVMTASPEVLTLMLWDGAIRFSEQAKVAIQNKEIENSYNLLLRAQKIVLELNNTLKHEHNPGLAEKISALYMFIYRRLVDANLHKDVSAVDDALKIMRMQRETWQLLITKIGEERASQATPTALENAEALGAAADISPAAMAEAVKPAAHTAATNPAPARRIGYPNLANKPLRTSLPAISVQG
jgi:flagellar protein FliS